MNQAALYLKINEQGRQDGEKVLKKYGKVMKWRKDGRDALIDIGTGSGEVLMNFVYPLMPTNFEKLVGTDLTEEMVSFCRERYAKYERVKFEVLDIGADKVPEHLQRQFDHVTSFYCLHWVQNQRKMLENISNLLRSEGGDCLFSLMGSHVIYDIYEKMSAIPKWSSYFEGFKQFISPYHKSPDVVAEFRKLLQESGFVDCCVEAQDHNYVYKNLQDVRDLYRALCPFFDRIPEMLHEEFLDDFVRTMEKMKLRRTTDDSDEFDWDYKLVEVYARKPSTKMETMF